MFSVANVDCAACALAIEKRLKRLEGVDAVGASIMLNNVFVDYDGSRVSISDIMKAIKETGYSNHLTRSVDHSR